MQFSKRVNSTKTPTAEELAGGVKLENVVLKESTNIDNPTLIIDGTSQNLYAYNYIYIHEWGRYYFIDTCDLRHNSIFTVKCSLDDLATYKTQILGTTAYVIYSSSDYNIWIRDDRTPIVARPPEIVKAFSTPMIDEYNVFVHSGTDIANETVILTTYSQDVGIAHWCINEGTLDNIMDALIRAGSSIQGSMQMLFGDALGSIISAIRLPFYFMGMPTDNTHRTIYLGDYAL